MPLADFNHQTQGKHDLVVKWQAGLLDQRWWIGAVALIDNVP